MSHLDQAFIKAYSKKTDERMAVPNAANQAKPELTPAAPAIAPVMSSIQRDRSSQVASRATAVVASRSPVRSTTIPQQATESEIIRSHLGPSGQYYRVDKVQSIREAVSATQSSKAEVKPQARVMPVSRATSAPVQAERKPLSQFKINAQSNQTAEGRPVSGLNPALGKNPAIYTHPPLASNHSQAKSAERLDSHAKAWQSKAELRKAAAATSLPSGKSQIESTKNDTVYRSEHSAHAQGFAPVAGSQLQDLLSVQTTERLVKDFDVNYERAMKSVSAENEPARVANPVKTEQRTRTTPAVDTQPATRTTERWKVDESSYRIDEPNEPVYTGHPASVNVVKSLSEYDPSSERSRLYQETKRAAEEKRAKSGSQLAQAVQTVSVPLSPAWEVDNFQWPYTVLDLLEAQEQSFDEIASHLQNAVRKGLKVVALTSAERGVGKSTAALCLAAVMAHAGMRVALFDGDVECPSLFNQLNLELTNGWQDCLKNNVPLDEVAIHAIEEQITLFPLTDSLGATEVEFYRERINKMIKRVASAYDLVIVDAHRLNHKMSRLLACGEDTAIDAAMLVIDSELSVEDRIETALQLLHEQGLNSVGIVENFNGANKAA